MTAVEWSNQLRVVTITEFVDVDEPGASALLGADGDSALIPEGGDVMTYGDGGAGKTTLMIDLACHLAAGDPWLGIPVGRPVSVLLIENEGPRPQFRKKLKRKLDAWAGSAIDDRIRVLAEPWGVVSLADELDRQVLAEQIEAFEVDVVMIGPLTRIGMDGPGTLQEVRDFMRYVGELRRLSGRAVAVILIHHENKGGQVSGAWEGAGDTLLHIQGQGHGRTRLFIQKARWSSSHHGTSLHLTWADGDGFEVAEPERDDDTVADEILEYVRQHGGTNWAKVDDNVDGKAQRKRQIRDRLLAGQRLVNIGSDSRTKLWHAEDPSRPGWDGSGTASPSTPGEEGHEPKPSPVPPLRGRGRDGSLAHPAQSTLEDAA